MKITFLVYHVKLVSCCILVGFIHLWGKDTEKTVVRSRDSEFPTSAKCNIASLMRLQQDGTIFDTVGCRQMKVLTKLLDVQFLVCKEHKMQNQLLRGVLKNRLTENFSCSVALLDMWSKSLKIHLDEFIFGGVYICSRMSSCTGLSICFSTVADQLFYKTSVSRRFLFCCFSSDMQNHLCNPPVICNNLSGFLQNLSSIQSPNEMLNVKCQMPNFILRFH